MTWQAVIKVDTADAPELRAEAIAAGVGYACALLMDEYGWTAEAIERHLQAIADQAEEYEQEQA